MTRVEDGASPQDCPCLDGTAFDPTPGGDRTGRKARRKALARAEGERRRERAEAARGGRGCYCRPGDVSCGACQVCGRPGHVRHFPGAAPYTGSWCDRHYRRTALLHPNGVWGRWLWLAALGAVATTLWVVLAR